MSRPCIPLALACQAVLLAASACAPDAPRRPISKVPAQNPDDNRRTIPDCALDKTAPECAGFQPATTPGSGDLTKELNPNTEELNTAEEKPPENEIKTNDNTTGETPVVEQPVDAGVTTGQNTTPGSTMGSTDTGGMNPGATPGTTVQNPPPQGGNCSAGKVEWKSFYRAQVNETSKRQGGWNKVCAVLRNGAEVAVGSSVCNKRQANGCWVFHESNQGLPKCIDPSQLDTGLELSMSVTFGAKVCSNGEEALDGTETGGFMYRNADGTERQPTVFRSKVSADQNRFKCGFQRTTTGFKYKVCFEDNAAALSPDPTKWDRNDFVVVLHHDKELNLFGLTCTENDPILSLADGTCQ